MDDEQASEPGLVFGSAFVIGCFVLVEERLDSLQQLFSGRVVEVENEPRRRLDRLGSGFGELGAERIDHRDGCIRAVGADVERP